MWTGLSPMLASLFSLRQRLPAVGSYFIGGFLAVATWGGGVVWRPEILMICN